MDHQESDGCKHGGKTTATHIQKSTDSIHPAHIRKKSLPLHDVGVNKCPDNRNKFVEKGNYTLGYTYPGQVIDDQGYINPFVGEPDEATSGKRSADPDDGRPDIGHIGHVRCLVHVDGEKGSHGHESGKQQNDQQFLGDGEILFSDEHDTHAHDSNSPHDVLCIGDGDERV